MRFDTLKEFDYDSRWKNLKDFNNMDNQHDPDLDGVEEDSPQVGSFRAQVAALAVGQTLSMTQRLDGDKADKATREDARARMRNFINAAVARARRSTGHTYITEAGEISTRSMDILVVVAVTRTE